MEKPTLAIQWQCKFILYGRQSQQAAHFFSLLTTTILLMLLLLFSISFNSFPEFVYTKKANILGNNSSEK